MDLQKLTTILKDYPAYRLKQVEEAVFVNLLENWNQASNLPEDLREKLQKDCPLDIKAEIFQDKDQQTAKARITLSDESIIETVLMRHRDKHNTVCVSCQVGCGLACVFCLTGRLGFKRNISAGEILDQVLLFSRFLKKQNQRVDNVVFMGMGEPMLNYDSVIEAIKLMNSKLNIGARKISISTVGITEGIKKLADEPLQINLALSLHAPDDKTRQKLIPIAENYPLRKILGEVKNYIVKTNRRVMVEYLLLKDVNDSENDARKLAKLLKQSLNRLFFVNLLTYNQTTNFKPASAEATKRFKTALEREKIEVVQRFRFGRDIEAACGQLTSTKKPE